VTTDHEGLLAAPLEHARQALAATVAAIASGLALVCTTSLAGVLDRIDDFDRLSQRFVGGLGLGVSLFVGAALVSLLLARRTGAGPFLAVGAGLAAVGLLFGTDLDGTAQLTLSAAVLGAATGCLVGGAACMPFELPWRWARVTVVTWPAPLVVGWPIQAWIALDDSRRVPSLVVPHVRGLALVAAAAVLIWSVASMLARPRQARSGPAGWQEVWWPLIGAMGVLCLLAVVIGVDARLRLVWMRPVIFVATALALAIWVLVMMLIPSPAAKVSYLAVSFVGAVIPTTLQLVVVADAFSSGTSATAGRALVVLLAGIVGVVIGHRYPRRGVVTGLMVVAAVAVLAWPGYETAWVSTPLVAGLVGAAAAVVSGGFSLALESEAAVRLVSFAFVSALAAGLLLAVPLGWALVGDLPLTPASSRANSRVYLGLLFSAAVLVAAHAWVLGRRIDRRLRRALQPPMPQPG
jgi:hypothetical protein